MEQNDFSLLIQQMKLPHWTDIVKTGVHKELAPYDPNLNYIRAGYYRRRADVNGYHGREKADGTGYHDKLDVEPTLKATLCVDPTLKATGVVSKELAELDATTD
ncbi:hypothetical protein KSS87_010037 [Heliosperma pusillum]|nr:hypothetical protein KSS87_010037 [Heliosperma pusillum]